MATSPDSYRNLPPDTKECGPTCTGCPDCSLLGCPPTLPTGISPEDWEASHRGPSPGTWAFTARLMAQGDDSGFDWDRWKDEMKEGMSDE